MESLGSAFGCFFGRVRGMVRLGAWRLTMVTGRVDGVRGSPAVVYGCVVARGSPGRSYALPAPVCWFVILECVNTLAPGSVRRQVSVRIVGLPHQRLDRIKMILTQCAVCDTELGLTLGKKCGRCNTRYCGPECQVQHWKEGGHDKLCKKIKKQAAPSNTTQIRSTQRRRGRCGEMRRGHEGPVAISARRRSIGRRRRPRAHVCVPWNGGLCTCCLVWRSRRRFWSRRLRRTI